MYPAMLDVAPPLEWKRVQLLLRLGIFAILAFLGASLGWLFGALYLLLPIFAAAEISVRGGEGYLTGFARRITRVLRVWNAVLAYLALVTDEFPVDETGLARVRYEVTPGGVPTTGKALRRLITSLPELLVLAVLGALGGVVWLIAAIGVLFTEKVPRFAWRYLRYVVALQARLLAYHASLTDLYPPLGEAPPRGPHELVR